MGVLRQVINTAINDTEVMQLFQDALNLMASQGEPGLVICLVTPHTCPPVAGITSVHHTFSDCENHSVQLGKHPRCRPLGSEVGESCPVPLIALMHACFKSVPGQKTSKSVQVISA